MRTSYEGTIFSKVMKQQRPLLLYDMDNITHPVEKEIFIAQGVRNAFLTPLKIEGQITGILILGNIPQETDRQGGQSDRSHG